MNKGRIFVILLRRLTTNFQVFLNFEMSQNIPFYHTVRAQKTIARCAKNADTFSLRLEKVELSHDLIFRDSQEFQSSREKSFLEAEAIDYREVTLIHAR